MEISPFLHHKINTQSKKNDKQNSIHIILVFLQFADKTSTLRKTDV
jgi:hypothetical protein